MTLITYTKTALALFLITGSLQALGQDNNSQTRTYSLELGDPTIPALLEVEMRNGGISIEGYDGKTVEVTAIVTSYTQEELKNLREQNNGWGWNEDKKKKPLSRSTEGLKPVNNRSINLEIDVRGNRVDISSEYTNYNVQLTVKVPMKSSVEAEVFKGRGIKIANVSGALELESFSGNIEATGVTGPMVAETHANDIIVEFADLSSTSPTSLTTHNGDIDITLANSIATTVNVKSYKGEILSGLDAEFVPVDEEKRSKKGNRHTIEVGGQLAAKVNGGGQSITLNTYDGNIYMRKQ